MSNNSGAPRPLGKAVLPEHAREQGGHTPFAISVHSTNSAHALTQQTISGNADGHRHGKSGSLQGGRGHPRSKRGRGSFAMGHDSAQGGSDMTRHLVTDFEKKKKNPFLPQDSYHSKAGDGQSI